MNKKHILILSAILGALVLGMAAKSLAVRLNSKTSGEVYMPLAFAFDPAKIERIEIGRGTKASSVILVKEKGEWKVRSLWGAEADGAKVMELLDGLRNMKGELRSSDPAVLADFGITDADAFSVRLAGPNNKTLLDLRAGSKQAGYGAVFVRRAGSADVYYVGTDLDRLLGIYLPGDNVLPASGFWADLGLFRLDPEKVSRIEISDIKEGAVVPSSGIERTKNGWKLIGPDAKAAADPEKVLRYIATLNSVRAQDVADPAGVSPGLVSISGTGGKDGAVPAKGEAKNPVWRLAVTEAGRETVLLAGPQQTKDNVYFVKFSDRPEIFRLTAYYFEDLNVKNEKFVKIEAAESAT